MDFELHPSKVPAKGKPRSFNAHKMDLDFLCTDLTKMDLNKPSDQTHNKVEKANPTSEISNKVVHSKTWVSRSGASSSIIKHPIKKVPKVGWASHASKARNKSKPKYISRSKKRELRATLQQIKVPIRTKPERDPAKISEIFTLDPRKGYRHVCMECKRMYQFRINLLNHDIVDHHLDRAYAHLPSSRSLHSTRRTTEMELVGCTLLGGDASSDINTMGNPEQWIHGDLTILNVQWARYLFDDEWTLKICMDSGMSFGETKKNMERLDDLDRLDREDFQSEKVRSEEETGCLKSGAITSSAEKLEELLGKRHYALWKAAVMDNELVVAMGKMMKGC